MNAMTFSKRHLEMIERLDIYGANPKTLTIIDQFNKTLHKSLMEEDAAWWPVDMPSGPKFGAQSVAGKTKILVYTPEHPGYGIKPQTYESIKQAIDKYDGPIDWIISQGDNPLNAPYDNVVYHHNKARDIVLNNGYDAFLSIEADMVIPEDTIIQLLEADADVVYGLYVWRHKPHRWSAYKTLTLWGGESISYNHNGHDAREAWGKTIDVGGLGMGCTLIRRNVLETIHFRLHDGSHSWIVDEYDKQFKEIGINPYRDRRQMVCDDWLLAMDAQHYGFSQQANLGVVCGHINGDNVLWPDPDADKFYRLEPAETVQPTIKGAA